MKSYLIHIILLKVFEDFLKIIICLLNPYVLVTQEILIQKT